MNEEQPSTPQPVNSDNASTVQPAAPGSSSSASAPQPAATAPVEPQVNESIFDRPDMRAKVAVALVVLAVLLLGMGILLWSMTRPKDSLDTKNTVSNPTTSGLTAPSKETTPTKATSVSHAPDHTKLPLGDKKYTTSAKKGYVYSCNTSYNGGGAFKQGPWINTATGTWNLNNKISVDGSVTWNNALWSAVIGGKSRTLTSRDLPTDHHTGTFPISSRDDAYNYDRNPNSIEEQAISFSVPANPVQLSTPQCIGGEVGIATTGVLIFNAFDAGGRDAVATEIQDTCEGHPQIGHYYHYHGYSSCFHDDAPAGQHSELQGYAFDGFGIYGLRGEDGKELSSADLDECHGHTHMINWDGSNVSMYHYHFTQDFPYTVSCFRGTPSVKALSSGEASGQAPNSGRPPMPNR